MNHYAALLAACCCGDETTCAANPCLYIAVDVLGVLEWQLVSNAPDPECEGDCGCFTPDIEPDCEGQIARCICATMDGSEPLDENPGSPNCTYETCEGAPP